MIFYLCSYSDFIFFFKLIYSSFCLYVSENEILNLKVWYLLTSCQITCSFLWLLLQTFLKRCFFSWLKSSRFFFFFNFFLSIRCLSLSPSKATKKLVNVRNLIFANFPDSLCFVFNSFMELIDIRQDRYWVEVLTNKPKSIYSSVTMWRIYVWFVKCYLLSLCIMNGLKCNQ